MMILLQNKKLFFFLLASMTFLHLNAQQFERCGTMDLLERNFKKDTSLQSQFLLKEKQLQLKLRERTVNPRSTRAALVTVPVVFHIVLSNTNLVTDDQVRAQLDTLNKIYAGVNADTSKIPSYFKSLLGKSGIQFCLAQRTPSDQTTTGIVRYSTNASSFTISSENIKHAARSGANAWNTNNYLNIWIGNLANNILGYSSLPDAGSPDEQGVVIDYRSLPGGSATNYNKGKTLPHEIGHYFFLYHIWGDDNGGCSGSDEIDDTPNQANSTSGCPGTTLVTDNCSKVSPGIMYQNFMDYTYDDCLVMFTTQQVARMEAALSTYRSSLFNSNGCMPLVEYNVNAELKSIIIPEQRLCNPVFTPSVFIRNVGSQTITSLSVSAQVDGGPVTNFNWSGTLGSLVYTTITLNPFITTTGDHILTVFTSFPNGIPDDDHSNDTLRFHFIYYPPFLPPIAESFEGTTFPPAGWDIVNQDHSYTWEKITGVSKSGNASVVIRNLDNGNLGQKDYLRLPEVNIGGVDSSFVVFNVAAATYTSPAANNNVWDTLEVLLSADCGKTYISIYKKWGPTLVTKQTATTRSFEPAINEWRQDSINISPYIYYGNVMIAFANTTGHQNNIYLDDIHLFTKNVNPNLKAKGFLLSPNPASGYVSAQFYPQPVNLQSIIFFTASGQKIIEIKTNNAQNNVYNVDLRAYPPGIYIVKAVFSDRTITRKLLRVR